MRCEITINIGLNNRQLGNSLGLTGCWMLVACYWFAGVHHYFSPLKPIPIKKTALFD